MNLMRKRLAGIGGLVVLVFVTAVVLGQSVALANYANSLSCLEAKVGKECVFYQMNPSLVRPIADACGLTERTDGEFRSPRISKFHLVSSTEEWITLSVEESNGAVDVVWWSNLKFTWRLF
jgi:hypothetical protein